MQLVKQIIVTSIRELNHIAQQAHLKFGDEPNKQINIIVGHDGKCEVEDIATMYAQQEPVNDKSGH